MKESVKILFSQSCYPSVCLEQDFEVPMKTNFVVPGQTMKREAFPSVVTIPPSWFLTVLMAYHIKLLLTLLGIRPNNFFYLKTFNDLRCWLVRVFFLLGVTAKAPWISSIFQKNGVHVTRDFNFEHQTSNRSLASDRCPTLKVQHVSKQRGDICKNPP